ncbi:MAG TPA: response regulator [Fibrobacteria bacterium]|nr:response regulator [Fibrobacteria bacterium]
MGRRPNSGNRPSTGRTILCVDDQVEFLESTRALLEREGHRVLTALDGVQCLAALESEQVDLLLLDYFMPGLSAPDILVQVRDPTLQVVLLTGYSSESPPRELIDRLDIQGYCDKSRGPDELLLWVGLALRHGAVVRQLEASSKGLRQVISSCLRPDEKMPLEMEMEAILAEASETLALDDVLVALAPIQPTYLPPSRLEEESDFWDPQGPEGPEDLQVVAAKGAWSREDSLESQIGHELARAVARAPRTESTILAHGLGVVPLRADGRWLGCILARPAPLPDSPQAEILSFLALQIANGCLVRQGATLDPVTGLQSRRFWREIAVRELRQAFRFGHSVSFAMVSIEGMGDMRAMNPRHADISLEHVGHLLRSSIRGSDLAGRGNQDELLLLLSHTGAAGAARFAELLSHRLEELVLPYPESHNARGLVGVATVEPHAFETSRLPRPMPQEYFPSVEELLRTRAAQWIPPADDSGFSIWVHPDASWPDPIELAARLRRSNFVR